MTNKVNGFFTDEIPDKNRIWTAAFLNERFLGPVSPLGWTLIRESVEMLALREPLRYIGITWPATRPLTRLYRGHPYTDAEAFWSLYKLFPDFLLPDDAVRYFPGGDISLRWRAQEPAGHWDLRVWWALGKAMLQDWRNWSPWHNWREWRRFESAFTYKISRLQAQIVSFEVSRVSAETAEISMLLQRVKTLNRRLLGIHRWSLTHSDMTYTLLRRSLGRAIDGEDAGEWSARLVRGVHNLSLQMDADLAHLAALRDNPGCEFAVAWDDFLAQHGHRSYSLDIIHPPFADDPQGVLALLDELPPASQRARREADTWEDAWSELVARLSGISGRGKLVYLRQLVELSRIYMQLRENQRYHWQRGLALIRRLVNLLGRYWSHSKVLEVPADVFFLTWEELEAGIQDIARLPSLAIVRERKQAFDTLRAEYVANPGVHYPPFLRGDQPLAGVEPLTKAPDDLYWGRAASPGHATGPAACVSDATQLGQVKAGSVLIARSTDPGWTPVFGKIAALVTETGGLLSHGAVVAREYGVPAVVAVPDIFDQVHDGQLVEVDGVAGRVSVIREP